jgi:hypothetical protein
MKLTIESERTFIFRNLGEARIRWCERCGTEAPMMNVADAARETGLSELAIYQRLDVGALHFIEDSTGHCLICLNSLVNK